MGSWKKIFHPLQNPYSNPQHPNHGSKPSPAYDNTFRPPPPPEQASPRGSFDFLAEARLVISRDPVTARRLTLQNHAASTPDLHFDTPTYPQRPARAVRGERGRPAPAREVAPSEDETSAFNSSHHRTRVTSSTRYDLYRKELEHQKLGVGRPPAGGYYAPATKQATNPYAQAPNWTAEKGSAPLTAAAAQQQQQQQQGKRKSWWFGGGRG